MYLKRLEIQGFKSFAFKTVLELETGLTAVVGPNGSGKSNVADSLRWVLGEQSAKQLRGKKSEDVIFAGSDKRVKASFAEVVATFDNSDRRIPLDSSEVSIGRRVDRGGESEYLINGNRVRLLDVVDLALKSSIGTSRYTVIGQGTIDQLILAGPGEIKSLLDEASGVQGYYNRREKTLRRLEQVAQNLTRARDVVVEIEPRLKSLRRLAKRQESRTELETELQILQRQYLGRSYHELLAEMQTSSLNLSAVLERIQDAEAKAFTLRSSQPSAVSADKEARLRQSLDQIQERKSLLLERRSMLRSHLQTLGDTGAAANLKVTAGHLRQRLSETETQLERLATEAAGQQAERDRLEMELTKITEETSRLYTLLQTSVTSADRLSVVAQGWERLTMSVERFLAALAEARDMGDLGQLLDSFNATYQKIKSDCLPAASSQQGKERNKIAEQLQQLRAAEAALHKALRGADGYLSAAAEKQKHLSADKRQWGLELEAVELKLQSDGVATTGRGNSAQAELEEVETKLLDLRQQEAAGLEKLGELARAAELARGAEQETEKGLLALQAALASYRSQETQLLGQKATAAARLELVQQEIRQTFTPEIVAEIFAGAPADKLPLDAMDKIAKLKSRLAGLGEVDELTMQEFRETADRFEQMSAQIHDLGRSMEDLRQIMDELDEHIKSRFNQAFHTVNEKFEYYFRILFNGGRAQLVPLKLESEKATLEQSGDVAGETGDIAVVLSPEQRVVEKYAASPNSVIGVDIKATPPGKKLALVQALSGGERALTSIALLCALLACFPSPVVVLDEVDAALDEANTIRFGEILGTLSHQTQFLTISHNRETMAQSKTLYGVTMGDDGVSKVLSLKFDQATKFAK